MSSSADKTDILIRVHWDKTPYIRKLRLTELQNAIDEMDIWPHAFECESVGLCEAILTLSHFAESAMDGIEINRVNCQVAQTPMGGFGFVPDPLVEGVEILAASSASWLPGGPCEMAQEETIYRFENLYWVHTGGDAVNELVVVGRFATEELGIRAAALASVYFYVDEHGSLTCELDDVPQDE